MARGESANKTPARNKAPDKILEEGSLGRLALDAITHLIRFSAIANAGGIIATMTVVGATAKSGDISNVLAVPLAFFAAGVVAALLFTHSAVLSVKKKITNTKWEGSLSEKTYELYDKYDEALQFGMTVFFILGCISGVTLIAIV